MGVLKDNAREMLVNYLQGWYASATVSQDFDEKVECKISDKSIRHFFSDDIGELMMLIDSCDSYWGSQEITKIGFSILIGELKSIFASMNKRGRPRDCDVWVRENLPEPDRIEISGYELIIKWDNWKQSEAQGYAVDLI